MQFRQKNPVINLREFNAKACPEDHQYEVADSLVNSLTFGERMP